MPVFPVCYLLSVLFNLLLAGVTCIFKYFIVLCVGKWHCFVCDSSQIKELVASCSAVLDAVDAYHKSSDKKITGQPDKTTQIMYDGHPLFISITSSSESDSDLDYDVIFSCAEPRVVVDYLKKSLTTLSKSVSEAEKRLARGNSKAKSEDKCVKKDLTRVVGKLHKLASLKTRNCQLKAVTAKKRITEIIDENGSVTDSGKACLRLQSVSGSVGSSVVSCDVDNGDIGTCESSDALNVLAVSSSTVKPSRDDMEAQRQLHRELLENDDDDENGKEDSNSGSNSSDEGTPSTDNEDTDKSSECSDDEYDPKAEKNILRSERKSERRQGTLKTKTKAGYYLHLCLIILI